MIDKKTYLKLKRKYGLCSSWAVWIPEGDTPKSNTGDMSWLKDPDLLEILNTGFIFVGLNCAGTHGDQSDGGRIAWKNFHSDYSRQNDYKIRYALKGTRYWGSYITDIIKDFPEVDSGKVKQYLKANQEIVEANITEFKKEISCLGDDPVLVAFGDEVYRILTAFLGDEYRITKVPHYSHYIGKEEYRKQILNKLKGYKVYKDQYENCVIENRKDHGTSEPE